MSPDTKRAALPSSPPASPAPKCTSLRWDRSTWHQYEPRNRPFGVRGTFTQRCVKCGAERTIEVSF